MSRSTGLSIMPYQICTSHSKVLGLYNWNVPIKATGKEIKHLYIKFTYMVLIGRNAFHSV